MWPNIAKLFIVMQLNTVQYFPRIASFSFAENNFFFFFFQSSWK